MSDQLLFRRGNTGGASVPYNAPSKRKNRKGKAGTSSAAGSGEGVAGSADLRQSGPVHAGTGTAAQEVQLDAEFEARLYRLRSQGCTLKSHRRDVDEAGAILLCRHCDNNFGEHCCLHTNGIAAGPNALLYYICHVCGAEEKESGN